MPEVYQVIALAVILVVLVIIIAYVINIRRMLLDTSGERAYINELLEKNQKLRDELGMLKIKISNWERNRK